MDLYFPLPSKDHVLQANHVMISLGMTLFQLAGQFTYKMEDLEDLCETFAGYTMSYNEDADSFTFKLYTRKDPPNALPPRG